MSARIQAVMAKRHEGEKGFTLIELLVVIIIIGILTAIAIPAFMNQREKGWVAQVEADLKNAATLAESYAVTNGGSYANMTMDLLEDEGFHQTDGVEVLVSGATAPTATRFVLTGEHDNMPGEIYTYDSNTGVVAPPAAPAGD